MRRVLVTGLCLSGNLGGPAMALTLARRLKDRYPGVEIRFAVPARRMDAEAECGRRYGFEVLPVCYLLSHFSHTALPLRALRRVLGRRADVTFWRGAQRRYLEGVRWSDRVIAMQGIAYVGDGTCRFRDALRQYSAFHYSRAAGRPYCRFVESYGPFHDWRVRALARRELGRLPFVMARGAEAARACRALLPGQEVHQVPDIAIDLPAAPRAHDLADEYTVLCPSAVLRRLSAPATGAVGDRYVRFFVGLARALLERGERLLFLPHSTSESPEQCDRQVCREILAALPPDAAASLVEGPLDPFEAKRIIGRARRAVVSRFHALVAALSCEQATPVVAVGWNQKYGDILEEYGVPWSALDARRFPPQELERAVTAALGDWHPSVQELVRTRQRENLVRVDRAFDRLYRWIESGT